MRAYLERRIPAQLRDRVIIEEGRGRSSLNAAIGEASVCCFPSLWENFPNVCLEAMAAGKTVVASDAGGMLEIIEQEKSGLLFPSGEVSLLADALARALTDVSLRRRLGAEAQQRLRAFCAPKLVVAQLEEAFASATRRALSSVPIRRLPARTEGPSVSVVVPFYNLGRTLPATLASIEAQTFRDLEVLIVDDGSTEPESRAALEQAERTSRVRVLRKPNGGLSSARNAGLKAARGSYVLPLDADDLIAPTFVEKTLAVLEADPACAYCTTLVQFFDEDPALATGGFVPWGHEPDLLLAQNLAGSCTALFRRERLEEAGGYDEWMNAYEDWDLYCALAERGGRGEVLPEFLFLYRIRPESMLRSLSPAERLALRSLLIHKHPKLLTSRAQRLLLWEAEQARDTLSLPRYVWADRVNDAVKSLPLVHRLLKLTMG